MKIEWLNMTVEQLEALLKERFSVKPVVAAKQAPQFSKMPEVLRADFAAYIQSGIPKSNVEIQGFSLQTLMQQHGMTPLGAFSTLDWLIRSPEEAKEELARDVISIRSPR